MNERIQELASLARKYAREHVEECRQYGYYMEHNEYEIRFEHKFAELILQECCVTADANIDDSKYPSYWIKRKFGVKE